MSASPPASPSHTVLIVDDEPEVLEALRRLLRRESYRVLTTTSPREALELVRAGEVDLLLSDIDMPEMDGLELVMRVRRARPEVVRMLLTGAASLPSALQAINDGEVHRYLTKPWDTRSLRATLREALERLDELRRRAEAERGAQVRDQLIAELEREHPGISTVSRDPEGAYLLDAERLDDLAACLEDGRLRSLFES